MLTEQKRFDRLSPEMQQLIRRDALRICDETWRLFIEYLPQKGRLEDDITPALPGIKRDFYSRYTDQYCDLVAYVLRKYDDMDEQRASERFLYDQEMRIKTNYVRYEPDLLAILQHLVPDENVPQFDYAVRQIEKVATALIILEHEEGRSLSDILQGTVGEWMLRKWEREIVKYYDALEPRSKVLRQDEYDGACGTIAYVLGEEGARYGMMSLRVQNTVAGRLHALDEYRRRQASSAEGE